MGVFDQSVNKAILVGRLGADPDVRQTQDGKELVRLSLATGTKWKDKNTGEKKETTEWHRIVIFSEGLAGIVKNHVKKGDLVHIEGKIRSRKYVDESGNEKWSTDIVLSGYDSVLTVLQSKNSNQDSSNINDQSFNQDSKTSTSVPEDLDIDDEIPF